MFYTVLGRMAWKFGVAYARKRFARQAKMVGGLAAASLLVGGWLAMRGGEEA